MPRHFKATCFKPTNRLWHKAWCINESDVLVQWIYSLFQSGHSALVYVTQSMGMSNMSAILNLIFQYTSLVHLKCFILIQTPTVWNISLVNRHSDVSVLTQKCCYATVSIHRRFGCRDNKHSLKFKNNEKLKNLSPFSAFNSKSIFPTSDSFPLIMSHNDDFDNWTIYKERNCTVFFSGGTKVLYEVCGDVLL